MRAFLDPRAGSFVAAVVVTATIGMAAPSDARASGYYAGIGLGGGVAVANDAATRWDGADTSGQLMLGRRFGPWSIEGQYRGAELHDAALTPYSASALGLGAKVHIPFFFGLEAYLKGNLGYGRISDDVGADDRWSGRGYGYGVGLLWAFRLLPVAQLGVWVDLDKQVTRYRKDGVSLDSEMRFLTVGLSIGSEL